MRTTIDLPDDLLDIARSLARGRKQTLGDVVADLVRRGLNPPEPARITYENGFPVLDVGGRTITAADVASLEEEEDEYLSSFMRRDADVNA